MKKCSLSLNVVDTGRPSCVTVRFCSLGEGGRRGKTPGAREGNSRQDGEGGGTLLKLSLMAFLTEAFFLFFLALMAGSALPGRSCRLFFSSTTLAQLLHAITRLTNAGFSKQCLHLLALGSALDSPVAGCP